MPHPAWSMIEPLASMAGDLIGRFMKSRQAPPATDDPKVRLAAIESRIAVLEENEQAQGALVQKLAERVDLLTRTIQTLRTQVIILFVVAALSLGLSLFLLISG